MLNLGRYSKAVTAVIGQALTYATLYYGGNKYVAVALAAASALGVYAVPNQAAPKAPAPPPAEPTGM
jgi:hypothetical protein